MLAREAFREMLFPLSEKELHYREHPEDSLIYFKNFRYEGEATVVTGADNSDEILFFPSPKKQAASNLHGVISPKIAPRVLEGGNLAFNKQTRFGMVPLHRHNYIEKDYVYSGTCVQEINGQTVEMHTGDVTILDRDVVHRVLPTGENDILLNCLMGQNYFKASFTERLAASGAVPDTCIVVDTSSRTVLAGSARGFDLRPIAMREGRLQVRRVLGRARTPGGPLQQEVPAAAQGPAFLQPRRHRAFPQLAEEADRRRLGERLVAESQE